MWDLGRRSPVAHHRRAAAGSRSAPIPREILVDLEVQGRGDHGLCPDARQLIERGPDQLRRSSSVCAVIKLQHAFP
jgi:hypothetical protein